MRHTRTYSQFVNETQANMSDKELDAVRDRVHREGMNLTQDEFNRLHDKLLANALAKSGDEKEAERLMLAGMGRIFEIPPVEDEHYENTVLQWPEFDKYFGSYKTKGE